MNMTKDTFFHKLKGGSCPLINGYRIYYKKKGIQVINFETDDTKIYKNLEELFENCTLNGDRLKDIVDKSTLEEMFYKDSLDDSGNIIG